MAPANLLEIPVAKNTDAEDVVWGLQTADTLWRRGERIDALVWLRRAAQAAGDANDDDRALELARFAAELTEWMANLASEPPHGPIPEDDEIPPADASSEPAPPPDTDETEETHDEARPSVPPAEKVHAGMYDPWAELSAPIMTPEPSPAPAKDEEEGVVTSVRPHALAEQHASMPISQSEISVSPVVPPARAPRLPAKPPPLPPRARPPAPPRVSEPEFVSIDVDLSGESMLPPEPPPTLLEVSQPDDDVHEAETAPAPEVEAAAVPPAPEPPAASAPVPPPAPVPALVLDEVEAFADLPDDARTDFASAAKLHELAEGDEIGTFALAYVVKGTFDVAATVVDASAATIFAGAVLRARGSTEEGVPMRLIATKGPGIVATWSDAAVEAAFRTCPWVEEDLRAAADRVQTLVGITIGPLGERLDVSIREEIVGRLTMRPLAPSEIVVEIGAAVPGLLLVGIGELELVNDSKVVGVVGSGEFLFPTEVLGAGSAPSTARAGKGGALVLFGDRRIAQELLVTCPPLLEVFAGM